MKFYFFFLILLSSFVLGCSNKADEEKPNIVWIMIEDWGYDLSCYGANGVNTPFVDKLASQGVMFTNSYCTSPVCSPSRSAMLTGFHQNYTGTNQHRTIGPGFQKKELPYDIQPVTLLLEDAGYYTCLMNSKKTDHNFIVNRPLFMGDDWSKRAEGQPFFAQVTFTGTHRKWMRDTENPIDENTIELPPYYPDHPLARRDWANGLEAMQVVDRKIGALLKRLEEEGLYDNTLVFMIGDNGRCMPRGKVCHEACTCHYHLS